MALYDNPLYAGGALALGALNLGYNIYNAETQKGIAKDQLNFEKSSYNNLLNQQKNEDDAIDKAAGGKGVDASNYTNL